MTRLRVYCNNCGKLTIDKRVGMIRSAVKFEGECPNCGSKVIRQYYKRHGTVSQEVPGRGSVIQEVVSIDYRQWTEKPDEVSDRDNS